MTRESHSLKCLIGFGRNRVRISLGIIIVVALLLFPAPLLPPHRLAENLQYATGMSWKLAYLAAVMTLQTVFYGAIGMLTSFIVGRGETRWGRFLQLVLTPAVLVMLALAIRSLRAGHPPHWINTIVPITACIVGVALGLGLSHRQYKMTVLLALGLIAICLMGVNGRVSPELRDSVEKHLNQILARSAAVQESENRFESLLRAAFAPISDDEEHDAVSQNRAAILAWGIAVGHCRLAPLVGLDVNSELVQRACTLYQGTTLRGREDWARHYALSAALAVLEHPLFSDAGGLMKEQLDALTGGSGFSFTDLAADRAGVRFATAATSSEAAARNMQIRLESGFSLDDFFPRDLEFAENLSTEQFRRDFGGVGSRRYRLELARIEAELDHCAALTSER